MRLLLRNGRILDPARGVDEVGDLWIEGGVIAGPGSADHTIDCSGWWVCPGFIDLHVHLREPGDEHKEDIVSGSRAAAAGGFTTICAMPNTRPPIDQPHMLAGLKRRSPRDGARVELICALTKAMDGQNLAELAALKSAGAVAASDDAFPIQSADALRRAMEYCRMLNLVVATHCEDTTLSAGGSMNAGLTATTLGLKGIPHEAEEIHVARNCILSLVTGCRLHVLHVSTKGSVNLIRHFKTLGAPVTAEACPHHFVLTDDAIHDYDTNFKMNPPLRALADVEAIRGGLRDGTIDCIATDHAPHAQFEKDAAFDQAPFGIVGLETAIGLTMTHLRPEPAELVRLMSTNPARVFGLPGGTLKVGSPADVTVVDPSFRRTVRAAEFQSRSRNTPFEGRDLVGGPMLTIVGGELVWSAGLRAQGTCAK